MKKVIRIILILGLIFGLYIAGVLIYGTVTDFQPKELIDIRIEGNPSTSPDSTFTFVTWNIGFTALGEETDFFYDGGTTVIQTEEIVKKNREGMAKIIAELDADVYLFQEVDSVAKRSHRVNHVDFFAESIPEHSHAFAVNYKVDFVPVPLYKPMGKVISGLANYSRFPSTNAERHAYPTQFSWPTSIFFLDRCFLSQRIPLDNGKELIAINTHCSAYDTSGTLVAEEIKLLMDFASAEFDKGNYVVIGGDWNQCPPNYTPQNPDPASYGEFILEEDQLPEGFSWVADPTIPTNRKLETVYTDSSYTSVIDHFVVSSNVQVERVQVVNHDFAFSDHQPVTLEFLLK
ncbi:MAG: endonuclease/exonuclease/phosphatase family protein [Flavobacteriales bacterium]|nr:endonuclease/exonuclease/phosphatase family protein [Flavobacteriales bacterium]